VIAAVCLMALDSWLSLLSVVGVKFFDIMV
jgi:hypothetical protein